MANEYVSATTLKATLNATGTSFADADIANAIESASRAVDAICGRRFYTTATDEVRYFTPTGTPKLRVGDLVSITELATDTYGDLAYVNVWSGTTDYYLGPDNADLDGRPWQYIIRRPGAGYWFVQSPRSVRITGKFGWSTAPPPVVTATSILASRLLRRMREAPFGIVTVGGDVGAVMRIARDNDVTLLLAPYVRQVYA